MKNLEPLAVTDGVVLQLVVFLIVFAAVAMLVWLVLVWTELNQSRNRSASPRSRVDGDR